MRKNLLPGRQKMVCTASSVRRCASLQVGSPGSAVLEPYTFYLGKVSIQLPSERLCRREIVLAAPISTGPGNRSADLGGGSTNLSLLSGGGDNSTDGHTCSPIREISTCRPHDEHLIVGRKADSLSPDMVAIQHFRVVVQNVLFEGEGKHWRCRHRHVLQKQSLSVAIGTRWRAASLCDIEDESSSKRLAHDTSRLCHLLQDALRSSFRPQVSSR